MSKSTNQSHNIQEFPDELVQSHKTLTITDEANVVRNVLLQIEHQLNQDSDRLSGVEYTKSVNTTETDQQRRLLFRRIQYAKNLICQTPRDTFLKIVNAEIRAGLYLVSSNLSTTINFYENQILKFRTTRSIKNS